MYSIKWVERAIFTKFYTAKDNNQIKLNCINLTGFMQIHIYRPVKCTKLYIITMIINIKKIVLYFSTF